MFSACLVDHDDDYDDLPAIADLFQGTGRCETAKSDILDK